MKDLIHESTIQTPYIHFSKEKGSMIIKGRSIPDDPEIFWSGVLNWFDIYMMDPNALTEFKIDLEYFNISSSKRILFLLYKLNEITKRGLKAKVSWYFRESDEDMFEVGQDYAFMVKVPFEFISYKDKSLVAF